ncbi:hypothetical protein J8281_15225 [Aquimarina sp. U1-2]|uniref:hypothetical protein n=1 Tax=Aquimarina sp. U1-2 TaxID=2823141 RepID=UPI001AEC951A|nr:hypothetical protein [Aquimarina sp. U1-2]MBP2833546.1 hypothetical protein [Aquimarina sp. U1-2]
MKLFLYGCIAAMIFSLCSCDTDSENTPILPSPQFDYISFESDKISIAEDNEDSIAVARFIYSSATLFDQDMTFNYVISSPATNAAQEGVDYELISDSSSFILPAGEAIVDVPLIKILNNSISSGTRSIVFTLQPSGDLSLGRPGLRAAKSVEISIQEDDLFEFGYTSFEEVPTFNMLTRYPRPAESQDPLPNIQDADPTSNVPYVNYISTNSSQELGFTASYVYADTADPPVIENEYVGVYNTTVIESNGSIFQTNLVEGNQAFISSDLDGTLTLVFDEITGLNPEVTGAVLDVSLYFVNSTYEAEDGIVIFFETDEGLGQPLLSLLDDDVDSRVGVWQNLRIPIPDDRLDTGRIVITLKNGATSEMIILDSISIKGIQ